MVGNKNFWAVQKIQNGNPVSFIPATGQTPRLDSTRSIASTITLNPLTGVVPVAYYALFTDALIINITLTCQRTDATYQAWQIKTFNAILSAWQAKQDAYNEALAEAKSQQSSNYIQGTNPAQNRLIERNELKRGCLNWLADGQNISVYGVQADFTNSIAGATTGNPPLYVTKGDVVYQTERAKFLEQCFEWDLLTYSLYP